MAGAPQMPESLCHARSTSMPSRSNPFALKIEEELCKLKASMPSSSPLPTSENAEIIGNALRGLAEFHCSIEELLRLPSSQRLLACPQLKKWVEAVLDGSLKLLDLCGTFKADMMAARERIRDLRLALPRKGMTTKIDELRYISFTMTAQKDIKKSLRALSQMDSKVELYPCLNREPDLQVVLMVLKEATVMTFSLLHSVISFMSKPFTKESWWSCVSKALKKKRVACEESVGLPLCAPNKYTDDHLVALESIVQGLETGLECLFRKLIQNRVTLLNILSL